MELVEAERLSIDARRVSGLLDSAVAAAQEVYSEEEFGDFRLAVGTIMAEVYELILKDIWDEFPELIPKGMENS